MPSQPDPDPQYKRIIDRLMKTGFALGDEDWNHVCDWGVVNATYMIDGTERGSF